MQWSTDHYRIKAGAGRGILMMLMILGLHGCAGPAPAPSKTGFSWAGRPVGSAPRPKPAVRQGLIARALREWQYFGGQTVVFKGTEESIPHVGDWEDDGFVQSDRVNVYWRSVGKPRLDGMDCRQPWSAAFMSYLMQSAGVPQSQFRPASAHWVYLASMIEEADFPGRYFVPRRIGDYSPEPGDLICAYRRPSHPDLSDGYVGVSDLPGMAGHCDLVVSKSGRSLNVIGGNVRNSVSRTTLELDADGLLQPVPRRPWFLVLQNRL